MNDKEKQLSDIVKQEIDPYTHAVLRKLGVDTLNSFTEEQRQKLIESISACRPLQRHPVDLRGTFSLFFFHFYYVILIGRDKRRRTKMVEVDRRRKSSRIASCLSGSLIVLYIGITLLIFTTIP